VWRCAEIAGAVRSRGNFLPLAVKVLDEFIQRDRVHGAFRRIPPLVIAGLCGAIMNLLKQSFNGLSSAKAGCGDPGQVSTGLTIQNGEVIDGPSGVSGKSKFGCCDRPVQALQELIVYMRSDRR